MEHTDFVGQIKVQFAAMRAAALAAGPEALVPTCPEWTVHDLVRHTASVHSFATAALRTAPDGDRPSRARGPEDWDELLPWWDDRVAELVGELSGDPATPVWTFTGQGTVAFWARRQAHETAIHRLDAEHARSGDAVPTLLFDPEFAADGVDEFLTVLLVLAAARKPTERAGRLLFHAADAGRAWEVRLVPGSAPEVGPVTDSGIHEDTSVAGTADAVYRAVWNRPSGAIVSGDVELLNALPRP